MVCGLLISSVMKKRAPSSSLFRASLVLSTLLGGLLGVIVACTNSTIGGGSGEEDLSAPDTADLSGGVLNWDAGGGPLDGGVLVMTGDGGTRYCYQATCQGKLYTCGNCIDDDGDGRIDSDDPDCLGACDNSENSFSPQIPGGNNAPCKQDCYFDQDTGSGNDNCYWDHSCDPTTSGGKPSPEAACAYNPATKPGNLTCTTAAQGQSQTCKDFCSPLTPNGCDCFGCCAIGPQSNGTTTGIWLGSQDANGNASCSIKDIADPAKCHPCQIVPGCFKPCGRCQLCIGKDTLPADCYQSGGGTDGGSGGTSCPQGLCTYGSACGVAGCGPCKPGYYCITGCCVPTIG